LRRGLSKKTNRTKRTASTTAGAGRHADFFTQNPHILQSFLTTQKEILYVTDPRQSISTLHISFKDGKTTHISKAQLYPILLDLLELGCAEQLNRII